MPVLQPGNNNKKRNLFDVNNWHWKQYGNILNLTKKKYIYREEILNKNMQQNYKNCISDLINFFIFSNIHSSLF